VTGKMSAMAGEVTNKAGASWDKLESIFEARTAKALGKLGVPTAKDVAALTERVDALASAVAKLGGKVAPAKKASAEAPAAKAPAGPAPVAPPPATNGKAAEGPKRGLVIYVDTTRIVIDLTAADGIRPGTIVSLRRDAIPIVHPVTGEMLGELDEEVATARVTETREKFSVADVQSVATGAKIQVKDRVVPK